MDNITSFNQDHCLCYWLQDYSVLDPCFSLLEFNHRNICFSSSANAATIYIGPWAFLFGLRPVLLSYNLI